MKTNNELQWLESWYRRCCNGKWEHSYGISIETIDNPGWSLKIGLNETKLNGQVMQEISKERTEYDWINCKVTDNQFRGYGGPGNLTELIAVFKRWEENLGNKSDRIAVPEVDK